MIRPKAVIPISLVIGLLFQTTAFASFPDVAANHANYDAIIYAQQEEIVSGYPDGTYKPNNTINRAEFVKIIVGAQGLPIDTTTGASMTFPDVNIDRDWFFPYVITAHFSHLIDGYPDGTFKPNNKINFAEASKIIMRSLFGFDQPAIDSPWYAPFVVELGERHAIPTSIHSFDQLITRGEMAEMMYRLRANIETKPSATYQELATAKSDTWKTYTSNALHFSVLYPNDWFSAESGIGNEFAGGVGFAPEAARGGDSHWGITVYNKTDTDLESLLRIRGGGVNRTESRETILVNGRNALLVTVMGEQSPDYPRYVRKDVYVETSDFIYLIQSGGMEDPQFTKFYNSFNVLDGTSSNTKTFTDASAGVSFSYPSSWKGDLQVRFRPDGGNTAWDIVQVFPCPQCTDGHVLSRVLLSKLTPTEKENELGMATTYKATKTQRPDGGTMYVYDVGTIYGSDRHVLIIKGSRTLFLLVSDITGSNASTWPEYKALANSIVFVNPSYSASTTSGFKEYKDEKYGYSFQYPASWPSPTLTACGVVDLTDSGTPSAYYDWTLNMSPLRGAILNASLPSSIDA